MEKPDYSPYIIGGIAVLFAFAMCFATATWILCKYFKANDYVKTQGQVIDIKEEWTTDNEGDSSRSVFYTIEFEVDGQKYRTTTTGWKIFGKTYIGEAVNVYYNPQNPKDVLHKKPVDIFLATVCYVVAGGCVIGDFVIFRKYLKLKKGAVD